MALNIELIQSSFLAVMPKSEQLSSYFYKILFERYPIVKPLFDDVDLDVQQKKLVRSIGLIVRNLENPGYLIPYLHGLGIMHVAYGAEDAHYPAVGECLVDAIAEVAGPLWNDELQVVWQEAYAAIETLMREGVSKNNE